MTRLLLRLAAGFAVLAALNIASAAEPARSYLGIGNSFTWNSTAFLDELLASHGQEMEVFVAGIGGASLEEHLRRIRIHKSDPNDPQGRPYKRQLPDGSEVSFSLKDLLRSQHWDYISIQQLSYKSIDPETYEPFAGELIDFIRQHSPDSEILVHMTWAYREDHHWFVEGKLTPNEMYEKLADAYQQLAERYDLRIIPIGKALQNARAMPEWRFSFPDPNFDYEQAVFPQLPRQEKSLNAGWYWRTDDQTGEQTLRLDATHAGDYGKLLGAFVHFEFFINEAPELRKVPQSIGLDPAKFPSLLSAARQANEAFQDYNASVD